MGALYMDQSLDTAVIREQIRAIYSQPLTPVVGSVISAALIGFAVYSSQSMTMLIWFSCLFVVLTLRLLFARRFSQLTNPLFSLKKWASLILLSIGATGLLWGVAPFVLIEEYSLVQSVIVALMYFALICSAGSSLYVYLPAFYVFTISLTAPVCLWLFSSGLELMWLIVAAIPVFIVVNVIFAHTNHRRISESIKLRFENQKLIQRLEAEKQRAEDSQHKAEQAVLAKDRFLAAASHDLRQPLHAQSLYLDLIEPHVDEKGGHLFSSIRKSTKALSQLFDSLLDVSRLDTGVVDVSMQHLMLDEVLEPLIEEFTPQAESKGLELQFNIISVPIYSDGLLLERILRNYLSNALRYTDQGSICVNSFVDPEDNNKVTISVNDTGVGIEKADLNKIFNEFYHRENSENGRSNGLGLGLAIVKRLCDLLDITYSCESFVDQGSTFSVSVNLGDQASIPVAGVSLPNWDLKGVSVVVIDDEMDILLGTSRLLNSWGCEVAASQNIKDAIKQIEKDQSKPSLIIADYRLENGANGAEAVKDISNYLNYKPSAIIITGDTSEERLREAKASGLLLLHKPVSPAVLRMAINRELIQKQSLDQQPVES